MKVLAPLLALALLSCGDDEERVSKPIASPDWVEAVEIGPVSGSRNYSVGVPLHPLVHPDGWAFDFPLDGGNVNYLTVRGSLAGKSGLILRYRIEAGEGVQIAPKDHSGLPSQLALYFQRCGDTWSGRGAMEGYRWYSTKRVMPIAPGEHTLEVSFVDQWGAIETSNSKNNPTAFAAALADTCRFGFVMGGGNTGVGHGVYATGPARMIVMDLKPQK